MKRMTWWLLCWLTLFMVFTGHNQGSGHGSGQGQNQGSGHGSGQGQNQGSGHGSGQGQNQGSGQGPNQGPNQCHYSGKSCKMFRSRMRPVASDTRCCMEDVDNILRCGNRNDTVNAMKTLEHVLETTEVNESISMSVGYLVAFLHKPKGPIRGLDFYASEKEVMPDKAVNNSKVRVRLPKELVAESGNTIVVCMFTWPDENRNTEGASDALYESRMVGVSVGGKTVSGLQEPISIRMSLSMNASQKPSCVFFNFSTQVYSDDGCTTQWEPGWNHVTCNCNHLTYFGVLMVSADISPLDQTILTYITLIGCSLSLVALAVTVLLFVTKKKVRADVSMKVHINLAIALILLNLHFLPSQAVAAQSSDGLCFYMALGLHYCLLATFCWMALEGFHLYLLLVRVFNIYVRRYLLKLSLVGWGIPAVIVSLVVIIDRDTYKRVPLDMSKPNSTAICYIDDDTVKMVTTVGVFCLVFAFNMVMLGVTVQRVVVLRKRKVFGQSDGNRAKRDICTLLGVCTLLGTTWGLVFFSFGYLTTPGLYLFCIMNSLQGVFIFLWFVMSMRKIGKSTVSKTRSETRSTNSQT